MWEDKFNSNILSRSINCAKQNWIRTWILNKDNPEVSIALDDDLNLNEWVLFSTKAIKELKKLMKKDAVAVFVIGDVAKTKTSGVSLAREFCSMVKEAQLFKNVWCISDVIDVADKTTRIWGESKGSATATDRIVILSDISPFEKFKTDGSSETLDYDFFFGKHKIVYLITNNCFYNTNKYNETNNTNAARQPTSTQSKISFGFFRHFWFL